MLIWATGREFPGITVGGGFAGTSAESSSFKHGLFERTITWIELILPNGSTVTASPAHDDPHSDLFQGVASSFGTFGIVTLLRVRLVTAKQFVKLKYLPVQSMQAALETIESNAKYENMDYIDGIMYGRDRGVVCVGKLASSAAIPPRAAVRRFTRATDPWFYSHVEPILERKSSVPIVEAVPLRDYLFRYDRAGFWTAAFAFKYFWTPLNFFTRWLLDGFMRAGVMFHALHKSGLAEQYVVQDVAVPMSRADEFMNFVHQEWGQYPIWLCPLKVEETPPLFHRQMTSAISRAKKNGEEAEMLLNFGIWGPGFPDQRKHIQLNRIIEKKVYELNGQKCLYAEAYYTEEEFWSVYDKDRYDALRKKYDADWLPNVFDKVKVDLSILDEKQPTRQSRDTRTWTRKAFDGFWNTWPFNGIYAVAHTVLRSDYLIRKERHLWGTRQGGSGKEKST